jgi:ArsR family transcriptional regulator, arsenate/arsenite/antimonite-responsive transcriptional repressor
MPLDTESARVVSSYIYDERLKAMADTTFHEDHVRLAELARALSHPARIAILTVLAERNTCVCGEIVDVMPLSQATVSQHLKVLKEAGLIDGEVSGPRSCYCLNHTALRRAEQSLEALFRKLSAGDCC